ncbi:MAG: tryptophan-rich sensory protein [Methanolinea sp.]|nr:tryptophan-rich sensory protein [Methanolinea sp.]
MENQLPDRQPASRFIRSPVRLLAAILVSNLAGVIGSVFTVTGPGSWYASIVKPSFNPPGYLFGPVWTTLYILMGISLYLVWMEGLSGKKVTWAVIVFAIQLCLNTLWSILFFGLRSPFLGLVEIVVLWVFIAVTIVLFYRISRPAAYLLVPYILWVTFASFLTYTIWTLNTPVAGV